MKKDIENYWDMCSEKKLEKLIEEHLSDTEEPERKKIRQLINETNTKSILDIGCGPATELEGYKKYNMDLEYVGIDSSVRMLDYARSKYPNSKFVYGQAENIPFPSNSFDTILLKHILEHLPRYDKALYEAKRVSKENIIINFFKKMIDTGKDIHKKSESGYWDNVYNRKNFEQFLDKNFKDYTFFSIGRGNHKKEKNDIYDYDTIYLLKV